jgi:DNA-binding LacI/PurR family transcriptional regulator
MQETMPEYMKVRAHLFKLILNSDGESLQITPENELCRLFDVSRVTVRRAIKGLTDEGYLISRRGLGTFINYKNVSRKKIILPAIGVIKGKGDHVLSMYDTAVYEGVHKSGMSYQPLYMPNSRKVETLLEIVRNNISGIIWDCGTEEASHKKYINAIMENKIPLLLVTEKKPITSSDYILSTRYSRGAVIADHLFSKGHTKALFVHNDESIRLHLNPDSTYRGFCDRMTELCGDKWGSEKDNVTSGLKLRDKLEENTDFTAVYSGNYLVPYVMEQFSSLGLSVPEDISYLTYEESSAFFFNGLKPDFIDRKDILQDAVCEWLKLRITEKDHSNSFKKEIELRPVSGETVKVLQKEALCSI